MPERVTTPVESVENANPGKVAPQSGDGLHNEYIDSLGPRGDGAGATAPGSKPTGPGDTGSEPGPTGSGATDSSAGKPSKTTQEQSDPLNSGEPTEGTSPGSEPTDRPREQPAPISPGQQSEQLTAAAGEVLEIPPLDFGR